MKLRKAGYIVLGFVSVGLGAIGVVIPVLPTLPFLLLSAFCFAKSSRRLHIWFEETKLYRSNLQPLVMSKGMEMRGKMRVMVVVTLTMAAGFLLMRDILIGRILLAAVWVSHILYFSLMVKTLPPQKRDAPKEESETDESKNSRLSGGC